jgi:hypothetical protein
MFGASMGVALHDDLLIVVHPEGPPTATDWATYLDVASAMEREAGSLRTLVLTRGGVPDAAQRTAYTQSIRRSRVAVVSDSIAARATTRYMAIWNRGIRPFGASELGEALRYLGVDAAELRPLIAACEARLGPAEPWTAREGREYRAFS